jgi:hypothetical protein
MFLPIDLMISLLFGNNYIHRRPMLPTFRTSAVDIEEEVKPAKIAGA